MDVDKSGHLSYDDIEHMANAIDKKQNFKPSKSSSTPETRATEDTDQQHGTLDHNDATTLDTSVSAESNSHHHAPSAESLGAPAQSVLGKKIKEFGIKIKELEALLYERDLRIQSLQSELKTANSDDFLLRRNGPITEEGPGSTSKTLPERPRALVAGAPQIIVTSI
jgi:hypothetical protein